MKSFFNTAASAISVLVALSGSALADPSFPLPEPSSIALSGIGIAAALYFLNKSKRK